MIHTKGNWNDWKAEAEKALRGKMFESLSSTTYEGIKLKPLYAKEDYDSRKLPIIHDHRESNDWNISQVILAENSHELSEMIKQAKNKGQSSFYLDNVQCLKKIVDLDVAFLHIDWLNDSFLFDVGEDIGFIPLFLQSRKKRNELKNLKGTLSFDPYESILINGEEDMRSVKTQFDYLADTIKWCQMHECEVRCLLIKGDLYHEAGAHALQELNYTFSHALDVINELLNRGISIDIIAKNITFSFAIGSNFFMEIAKFRAAKQLWASLIHALGGNKESQKMYLHARTSIFNKTGYDVHVNLLRTTTEGFAAAVAGVDELSIYPFDYVLPSRGELGERIARNTQFILKEENLLFSVIDPAGGSYYVETLTNELAERAWKEIKAIDEKGGFLHLLKEGEPQKELEAIFEKRVDDVNKSKTTIIGTNAFANLSDQVEATLQGIKQANEHHTDTKQVTTFQNAYIFVNKNKEVPIVKTQNLLEQLKITPIKNRRLVEHFEQLRIAAETYVKKNHQQLKVDVIVFGRLKDYKPRLDFVTGLLASGGITVEVVSYDQFSSYPNGNVIIFCGNDEGYNKIDSSLISKIKEGKKSVHLFITGNGHEKKMAEYGLNGVITTNMNAYKFLVTIHHLMGVGN
ncbi:methylmalonyl-CoA mutase family protein [Metabacillus sp. FJAT-53654]|uniref:Methylmalonyl-CoA mutase family protein n=1 Tax=Metabacillus rhizosphaerae TaxID=3117747 RepID=A0ABZ2N0V0_9BACI